MGGVRNSGNYDDNMEDDYDNFNNSSGGAMNAWNQRTSNNRYNANGTMGDRGMGNNMMNSGDYSGGNNNRMNNMGGSNNN